MGKKDDANHCECVTVWRMRGDSRGLLRLKGNQAPAAGRLCGSPATTRYLYGHSYLYYVWINSVSVYHARAFVDDKE